MTREEMYEALLAATLKEWRPQSGAATYTTDKLWLDNVMFAANRLAPPPPPPPPPPVDTKINVTAKGIKANGTTDDTAAFNALVAASPVGSVLWVPTDAVCLIDPAKSIQLKSGITLQIDGQLKAKPTTADWSALVLAISQTDVHVTGLGIVQGSTGPGEHGMGVALVSCEGSSIAEGLEAIGCPGDGFYISWHWGGTHLVNCRNITLDGLRSKSNKRNSISITGLIGGTVRRCKTFPVGTAMPMAGLGFEPDAGWAVCKVEDVLVDDCDIAANGYQASYVYKPSGGVSACKNITYRNCRFVGGAKYGVVDDGINTRFENCVSTGSTTDLVLRGTGTRVIGGSYAKAISVQGKDIQIDTMVAGKPYKYPPQ